MHEEGREKLLDSLRASVSQAEIERILCGGQTFHVHKAIVCPRSSFFKTACKWGQEGEFKDEIHLDANDDDPQLVRLMIDYFYQLDYDDRVPGIKTIGPDAITLSASDNTTIQATINPHSDSAPTIEAAPTVPQEQDLETPAQVSDVHEHVVFGRSKKDKKKWKRSSKQEQSSNMSNASTEAQMETLTANALMYALADKYNISDLKDLARVKFSNEATAIRDYGAFVRATEVVFSTTVPSDQGLRDVVIDTLLSNRHLIQHEQIKNLLNSGNGIAWKLLQRSWQEQPRGFGYGYHY